MIQETEDDHVDQSLRDTFSDFDLLPAGHIWAGVEGHLSALPGPPRPVPLLLLLPAVGLVGVAVGWLLPRPVVLQATPAPNSAVPAKTRTTRQPSSPSVSSAVVYAPPRTAALPPGSVPKPVAGSLSSGKSVGRSSGLAAGRVRFQEKNGLLTQQAASSTPEVAFELSVADLPPLALEPLTEERLTLRAESGLADDVLPIAQPATATEQPLQDTTQPGFRSSSAGNAATLLVLATKSESQRERRPAYRVPTHRMSERGRGLRRLLNNVAKQWQHAFGRHRARVTACPDF